MKTILETLTIAAEKFEECGVDSPRLTAELLLAHALKCKRIELYLRFDQPLKSEEREIFGALYKRRLAREPLQYLIGSTNFCGLEIEVSKDVLIPRPETEELVELVKEKIASSLGPHPSALLDIGTGSGCIALALAKKFPDAIVEGIDISAAAIAVAQHNAEKLSITNCTFHVADIFDDSALQKKYDVIVSNPPYISAAEIERTENEVREFEPRIATTDNADGYTFYRRIAAIAAPHLNPNGFLAMEIGAGQSSAIQKIFSEHGWNTAVHKDLSGVERMVVGEMQK